MTTEVTKKNKVLYDGKGNLIEKIKAKKEIITKQKKVICIEKIIVREKSNKVLIFSTFSNLGLGTPVDEYNSLLSSYFNFGSSIEFSLPFNINTTMLLPHLRAEINIVNFQNSVYGATFQLGLSYRFLSSSWLSNLRGEIFTSIMTGLAHFEIRTNNLVDFQQNYVISPIVGYEVFFNRIQVFLHLKADIIGDAQTPLISMGVNIGAGYYF